jgi:hypothetical protein
MTTLVIALLNKSLLSLLEPFLGDTVVEKRGPSGYDGQKEEACFFDQIEREKA